MAKRGGSLALFVCKTWILVALCHGLVFTHELKAHKRTRRYLTFPKGSNLVVTLVLSKTLIFTYPMSWNSLVEIDVLFPLPNISSIPTKHVTKWTLHPPYASKQYTVQQKEVWREHRRQKRDIYRQIETLLFSQDIDGRACIRRFLCEINHLDEHPLKGSLFHDWMKVIFTYFDQNSWTEQEDTIYDIKDCLSEELKSCSFQLRDFANLVFSIFSQNIS